MVIAAFTAMLLTCDAWFDVTTASGRADTITAIASALVPELLLAALLFAVAHPLLRLTVRGPRAAHGILDVPSALHKVPLFGVPREPATGTGPAEPGIQPGPKVPGSCARLKIGFGW